MHANTALRMSQDADIFRWQDLTTDADLRTEKAFSVLKQRYGNRLCQRILFSLQADPLQS
jgi:hypothetical protein